MSLLCCSKGAAGRPRGATQARAVATQARAAVHLWRTEILSFFSVVLLCQAAA